VADGPEKHLCGLTDSPQLREVDWNKVSLLPCFFLQPRDCIFGLLRLSGGYIDFRTFDKEFLDTFRKDSQ